MGLDTVELVLEIEERFGIQVLDGEASRIATVGQFHELILSKLAIPDSRRCITAAAFYRLRRAVVEVLGVSRREVYPKQPLADLVPLHKRRLIWPALSRASHLRMPRLRRPLLLSASSIPIWILILLLALLLSGLVPIWQSLGCGLAVVGLSVLLTRPLAVFPCGRCNTVGDLASALVYENYGELAGSVGEMNRASEDVWMVLTKIISEQLGVRVEEITPASRFVQDLNCG